MLSAPLLAELVGVRTEHETALPEATGVAFHSARVRPGDAFFALPGAAQHGLAFADEALRAGAAFVVSDKPHPRGLQVPDPAALLLKLGAHARGALRGTVVGITGSAGKTSTKALAAAALDAPATPGNFNTPFALAQVLVDAWLGGRTGAGERLVLELGVDHLGEMDTLVALTRPDVAVLTLIAPSHLSGLGDVAGVAREKLKLVAAAAHALVSAEAAPYLSAALREKSTVYGLEGRGGDIEGRVSEVSETGQTVEALGVRVTLPYLSEAMAQNAVAALSLAQHLGLDMEEAAERLSHARLEGGRLQLHRHGALTVIDDSYNSSPAAASVALGVLERLRRPHSAVLGDMLELGAASEALHRALGRATLDLDRVIAVGPEARFIAAENPRAEHFEALDLAAVLKLLPNSGTLLVKGSRGMRLERLVTALLERNPSERGVRA